MVYKIFALALLFNINFYTVNATNDFYKDYPVYNGNDLGVHYHKQGTFFKVWAPLATDIKLRIRKIENCHLMQTWMLTK